jgi:hypothetical protein
LTHEFTDRMAVFPCVRIGNAWLPGGLPRRIAHRFSAFAPFSPSTPALYQRIHPMMIRLRYSLLSAAFALSCLSAHAQQTDGLQQRMSADEFKAAGLDKLSPQELQSLEGGWLHTAK